MFRKKNTLRIILLLQAMMLLSCAQKNHAVSTAKASVKTNPAESMRVDLMMEVNTKFKGQLDEAIQSYQKKSSEDKQNETILFKLALLNIQNNDIKSAQKNLENILKLNQHNNDARRFLGSIYLSQGDLDRSKKMYEDIVKEKDQSYIEDAMTLSHLYLLEKNYTGAMQVLDEAEKKYKQKHVVYFYKARAYSEQQDFKKAREYFIKSKKKNSKYTPNLKALGYLEEYEGRYKDAYKYFEQTLKITPEDKLLQEHLAELYLSQKKYKQSKKHYLQLHESDKENATYLIKLSINHYYLDEYTQSKAYLNELLKHHPKYDIAYYYLGMLQEKTRDFDNAITSFSEVKKENEYYVDANLIVAQILFDQSKKNEAETRLIQANKAKYDERFVRALGRYYSSENNFDKAEKILKKYMAKEKDNQQYLFAYAQVLEAQKKYSEMEKILYDVIENNPDHARALNYLGYSMLERDQNIDDAFVYIQRAHGIAPENPYITDSLGWAYFKKKNFSKAEELLKKAHDGRSDETIIKEHLADTYVMLKQKSKAKMWYKKALNLSADEEDKKRIQDKLSHL